MMQLFKAGLIVAGIFLGVQVGRDLAHKYVTPAPSPSA